VSFALEPQDYHWETGAFLLEAMDLYVHPVGIVPAPVMITLVYEHEMKSDP